MAKKAKTQRPQIVLPLSKIAKASHQAARMLAAQIREENRKRAKPMTRLEFDGSASGEEKRKEVVTENAG